MANKPAPYKFHEGNPSDWVKDPSDAARLVRENSDRTGLNRKTLIDTVKQGMDDFGQQEMTDENNKAALKDRKDLKHPIPSYKKGGRVRKTGLALVHKGEKVIPKHKVSPKRKR